MTDNTLITARGITSEVRTGGESAPSVPGGYHVTLLDYDRTPRKRVIDDACDLPGVVAVLESSPGSYHLWSTSIRPLDGTALRMLSTKTDPTHISVGYRRGRWTLRVGEKTRRNSATGDPEGQYKSPPEPVTLAVNESNTPVSEPHTRVLAEIFDRDTDRLLDLAAERSAGLYGDEKRVNEYLTMTDEQKP